MAKAILMPNIGGMQDEATITRWVKKEGDWVESGEAICEIATDKVIMDVRAPDDGYLRPILFQEGDAVPANQVIAYLLDEGENPPIRIEKATSVNDETPAPIPIDPALEAMVRHAMEDLAKRLDIDLEGIGLVSLEKVVWRDGSLGCPQPGMAYIQVLVDGLCMRLRAGGKTYHYHSGGTRKPFLCENPQEPYMPPETVER